MVKSELKMINLFIFPKMSYNSILPTNKKILIISKNIQLLRMKIKSQIMVKMKRTGIVELICGHIKKSIFLIDLFRMTTSPMVTK